MPMLADFSQIIGNAGRSIPQTAFGIEVPLPDFLTYGADPNSNALLIYSAINLTGGASVFINGGNVGYITKTSDTIFSTQLIAFSGFSLRDGVNKIVLKDVTDEFIIKDLICFYQRPSS